MLSKLLNLGKLSCPQIWNIEQEKDRERKRESGRQASEAQREKGDRELEREIKNKGDILFLEEQQENFVAAVTK